MKKVCKRNSTATGTNGVDATIHATNDVANVVVSTRATRLTRPPFQFQQIFFFFFFLGFFGLG